MSDIDQQIEQIEITIKNAKRKVAVRDAILRLEKNPDYRLVFEEHLFKDEAARTVSSLADPMLSSDADQAYLQRTLSMISVLQLQLKYDIVMGHQAEGSILENEELVDDLRAEEAEA